MKPYILMFEGYNYVLSNVKREALTSKHPSFCGPVILQKYFPVPPTQFHFLFLLQSRAKSNYLSILQPVFMMHCLNYQKFSISSVEYYFCSVHQCTTFLYFSSVYLQLECLASLSWLSLSESMNGYLLFIRRDMLII